MQCVLFTRSVSIEAGRAIRWFWRTKAPDERPRECVTGFVTRQDCATDAAKRGFKAADEDPLVGYF
jgi:hypothetical protein